MFKPNKTLLIVYDWYDVRRSHRISEAYYVERSTGSSPFPFLFFLLLSLVLLLISTIYKPLIIIQRLLLVVAIVLTQSVIPLGSIGSKRHGLATRSRV